MTHTKSCPPIHGRRLEFFEVSPKFLRDESKVEDIVNEAVKKVSTVCDLKNVKINITGNNKVSINCDFRWQVEAITNV